MACPETIDKQETRKTDLVVALDFGTTYSGYAYSFRNQFESNSLDVTLNPAWTTTTDGLLSKKTPTSLLLNPKGELYAFGTKADDKFAELACEDEHRDWYYFRRFKMKLHSKKEVKRGLKMKDELGKPMLASTVFSLAIRGLKDHCLETLKAHEAFNPDSTHIVWVLTVPAIWRDSAKQFMREAAVEAGINGHDLVLALEPEAASVFCQLLPIEKLHTNRKERFSVSRTGAVFMVVDLGGGTADITVQRRENDGTLCEMYAATGGPWGGVGVDRQFMIFITKLMGPDVMTRFSKENSEDLMDMYRCLETCKRTIRPESTGNVTIDIPGTLTDIYKDVFDERFGSNFPEEFEKRIKFNHGKLKVDVQIIKDCFTFVIDEIIKHVKDILSEPSCSGIKSILMVGGFADSDMVSSAMVNAFKNCRIVIPQDSETVVLCGAVIYGHSPGTISTRVVRYTYGVSYMVDFEQNQHPDAKKVVKEGEAPKCKDLFEIFVQMGSPVKTGEAISKVYSPARNDSKIMVIKVYASSKKDPEFVTDEGCWRLGKLVVDLPDSNKNSNLEIHERMIFGETELRVEAVEPVSGKTFSARFDFL
ncbi:heat shock 70 kDa protein 12B-like [Mizuhopecten yessoensis]|uniref:Heat shock 70 kDa protein n=1 Tax=Mizuhopecten yessoensis TaxID=6573 RepID=A0A1C9U2Y0_MIZYE|nr:heat shock 70 kDa protein 12B-like [Mizuhopecten yessoensis]XP_021352064.1 heat shock 70 kDa protein 12B-like [Mizuhopecten yessoensis]AOR17348.1 heat shock 70 kDa protein [Mizuhopecten yessoensis]OWF51206.1 Heat shock 70 kDa protein 12B [Mizuhopecten yessoensis]